MLSVLNILVTYKFAFLKGLLVTFNLSLISWSTGILGGIGLAILAHRKNSARRRVFDACAFLLSAIPLLVILFWFHFPLQALFDVVVDPFWTACFTLGLVNVFAVYKIVVRAWDEFPEQFVIAAQVCGLSRKTTIWHIRAPLLIRATLPHILSQQVFILQCTLFASIISVEEVFRVAQRINSTIYKPIEIYSAMAVLFIVLCAPILGLSSYLKKRYFRDLSEK